MNKLVVISILFAFLFANLQIVDARSGCCSSHGGVSGCGCADGTPLSATCLPYYPACSGGGSTNTQIFRIPTDTPVPVYRPKAIKKPKLTATPKLKKKAIKKVAKKAVKKIKKAIKKPTPTPKHKKKK